MPIESKPILVVGGAGFIGAHMVLTLKRAGFIPIILDNLSTGHKENLLGAQFIYGDMRDAACLDQVFSDYDFAAVMHFASLIDVAESVRYPELYYQNNVVGTLTLLTAMLKHKINHFIFSSSAAVYGESSLLPICESQPLAPINPYGKTKRMIEEMIQDYAQSYHFNYVILRYFNAAGADPSGQLRECHEPESHLIPIILKSLEKSLPVTIYGEDYATKDGTCIRDYVHVSDLCQAHLLAYQAMIAGHHNMIFNVGCGQGYSVREVIEAVGLVTKKNITVVKGVRRAGDAPLLVADVGKIKKILHWHPRYHSLAMMVEHAWQALQNN